MLVGVLQDLAQCDKRLHVAARAHHVDDDIERNRRRLIQRDMAPVALILLLFLLDGRKLSLQSWCKEIGKASGLLVQKDIDSAVI